MMGQSFLIWVIVIVDSGSIEIRNGINFKQRLNCSSHEGWFACLRLDDCVLISQSTSNFDHLFAVGSLWILKLSSWNKDWNVALIAGEVHSYRKQENEQVPPIIMVVLVILIKGGGGGYYLIQQTDTVVVDKTSEGERRQSGERCWDRERSLSSSVEDE